MTLFSDDKTPHTLRSCWLFACLILIGANLRAPITSLGPVLGDIQADLHLGATLAGALNALPLFVFAVLSLDERSRAGLPLIVTSIKAVDEWDGAFEEEASREGIYGRVLGGACHRVALNRRGRSSHVTRASKGSGVGRKTIPSQAG